MAIVADSSGNNPYIDKPLTKHNRVNAGDPNGALTPQYSGEIILDSTNKKLWQAQSIANSTWVEAVRIV